MDRVSSARKEARISDIRRGSTGEPDISIVAAGMSVTGEIESDGIVKIEGRVAGRVRAKRQVLVAKGGVVEGDIYTVEAIVGGAVHGAVMADERVEIQAGSIIEGDITTQRIVVQEGGEVNGHVRMANPNALEQPIRDREPVAAAEPVSTPAPADQPPHPLPPASFPDSVH